MGDTSQGEPFFSGAPAVASEVAAWHRGAFPDARREAVALKLVEEAVEAAVAAGASPMDVLQVVDLATKRAAENPADVEDEIGDVFIVLAALATRFVAGCPVAAASRKLDVLRARGPAEQARRDVARGIAAVPERERKVPRRDVPEHERVRKDRVDGEAGAGTGGGRALADLYRQAAEFSEGAAVVVGLSSSGVAIDVYADGEDDLLFGVNGPDIGAAVASAAKGLRDRVSAPARAERPTTREYVNDMLTRGREVARPVVVVRFRCEDCGGDVTVDRPGGCAPTRPSWPTAKKGVEISHTCEGCGRPYWFDGIRHPYLAEQAEPGTGGEA